MIKEEEKKESTEIVNLLPYSNSLIAEADRYCTAMHLPKEASSSVIRTLDNFNKLRIIIERQSKLPYEQRRMLVDTKTPLAEQPLKLIDDFVEMHMIPYTSMTWVEGHPYPKAEGLRYKLQADPRILKEVVTEQLISPPMVDKNNMIAGYKATALFWNNECYTAEGWADLAELQVRRKNSAVSPGFMMMIAETRAKRRLALAALGLPAGVAEEVQEGQEFQEASSVIVKPSAVIYEQKKVEFVKPKNLPEFLAKAYGDKHLSGADCERKLGVSLSSISDYEKAWDSL